MYVYIHIYTYTYIYIYIYIYIYKYVYIYIYICAINVSKYLYCEKQIKQSRCKILFKCVLIVFVVVLTRLGKKIYLKEQTFCLVLMVRIKSVK